MYCSEYDEVLFVEGRPALVKSLGPVEVRIAGFLSQAQLKSLDAVKRRLADAARAMGGNSVIDFKYGQRSRFLASLVGLDDVSWYGSGVAAIIADDERAKLLAGRA